MALARRIHPLAHFPCVLLVVAFAASAMAADAPKKASTKASTEPTQALSNAAALLGLPRWKAPAAYSVDMVMAGGGKSFTMKRFIAGDRIRSEITAEGQAVVMIEAGDEAGTTYTLMPKEKKAIKSTRQALESAVAAATEDERPQPEVKVEALGQETIGGKAAKKYRISTDDGAVLAWFDAASSAPLRMETSAEGETGVLEWKNLVAGPQPDKLFAAPKGYEVLDMDEMMAQMKAMSGAVGAKTGTPDMSGMMSGMMKRAGQGMGQGLGSSIGSAFGGALGVVGGPYIGGTVGGWVGGKAAEAATPGK